MDLPSSAFPAASDLGLDSHALEQQSTETQGHQRPSVVLFAEEAWALYCLQCPQNERTARCLHLSLKDAKEF